MEPIQADTLAPPELKSGEAHVWIARLDTLHDHPDATTILDEKERARAANFRFDRDRQLYMLGRATLRRILGAYLGIAPVDVPLRAGQHGKPELGPSLGAAALHFNVSHSGNLALYAVTRDGPVGVDVEQARFVPDLDGVADLVLSEREKAAFSALVPTDRHAFFHSAWARKEAYLKALGDGLMRAPTSIEFGALLGEPGETIRDWEDPRASERWRMTAWQPETGYWSALVTTIFTERAAICELHG
jgi:4'-phosphopantetheinyl transferase